MTKQELAWGRVRAKRALRMALARRVVDALSWLRVCKNALVMHGLSQEEACIEVAKCLGGASCFCGK